MAFVMEKCGGALYVRAVSGTSVYLVESGCVYAGTRQFGKAFEAKRMLARGKRASAYRTPVGIYYRCQVMEPSGNAHNQ